MISVPVVVLCLLAVSAVAEQAWSAGRVFLFPSTSTDVITVLDADDLSPVGSFAGSSFSSDVLVTPGGGKYYVTARSSTDSVLVVDPNSLAVKKRLNLGVSPSGAEITPDGEYLLVAAGSLRVISTGTDEEVGSGIPVGGGATQIVVDNTSTKAYVLADRGNAIAVVNLETLTVEQNVEVPNASSIALTPNDARLLVAFRDGLRQFRTTDLEEIDTIEAEAPILNAEILPLPNSTEAFVLNRSGAALNNSQIFQLNLKTVKTVGDTGAAAFEKVVILSDERAIGIMSRTAELVEIDLTATPDATVELLDFGSGTRDIRLSPNRKSYFLSSLAGSSVTKVDAATNEIVATVNVPIAPSSHALVFGPSELPPAQIVVNGGDNQFIPPGRTLPVAISVKVIDSDGNPIAGLPVLFAAEGSPVEVTIEEPNPSITNSRGIASAVVTIPPLPPEPEEEEGEEEALTPADEAVEGEPSVASEDAPDAAVLAAAAALEPAPEEQVVDVLQEIILTARTAGVEPAIVRVNLIRGTGLIKVGGDFQVTGPLLPFPEPFTILATDESGDPLPPGTLVDFTAFLARCDNGAEPVPTDPNGFASVNCFGERIDSLVEPGVINVQLPDFLQLGSTSFSLNISEGARVLSIQKERGDGQSARTGTVLPQPLEFLVVSGFPGGVGQVGVRIRQLSGPPVAISPSFIVARAFVRPEPISVRLGPNAGNIQIQAEVLAPDKPSVVFNLTATGGQPVQFEIQGDGQSARIGREIATPLRMRVINESGGVVPFPEVTWTVVQGDATLITASDPNGAVARVIMGEEPGPVVIRATIAGLVATFNLTATPPQPVSISTVTGQNQILSVGEISEPLVVQVNEVGDMPASNVAVEFSGPDFVILRPLDESAPGNPVQQTTNAEGQAGVRVELPVTAASLQRAGGVADQFSRTISIVAMTAEGLSTTFVLGSVGRSPAFEPAGIVNAATFQAGLVPGGLISLFGEGLSEGIAGTELAGGATAFQGTTVRIGGTAAPLISLTGPPNEQINLQAPFELSTGTTTTIEVENNGTRTTISGIPVFATQPGIFEIPLNGGGTIGAVIHAATGQLVTEQNPAEKGEAVSMFLTGGGSVTPRVGTGVLGPVPPSLMNETVVVGVDDKGADVLFSGYAPGFFGLYQINFVIPEEAACGVRPLSVRVGGSFSLPSTTAVRCP